MRSLRGRLLLGLLSSSTLVLAASGFALYAAMQTSLYGELDRSLVEIVRVTAPSILREVSGVEGWLVRAGPEGRRGPPGRDGPGRGGPGRDGPPFREGPPRPEDGGQLLPQPSQREDSTFQAWWDDGASTLRSGHLTADLPRIARGLAAVGPGDVETGAAHFGEAILPDGRTLRLAAIVWHAEPPDGAPLPPGGRVPQPLEIVVALDAGAVVETLGRLRWLLVLGCAGASALGALVIVMLLRSGLEPVSRLRTQIEDFDMNRPDTRFELEQAPAELVPVVDQLNVFVKRMGDAFAREQEFTSHAAHELRTPLAGLRATLEVALSRPRELRDHVASAATCLVLVEQMQRMVETLLDLARHGAGQHAIERVVVRPSQLVQRLWSAYVGRAQERELVLAAESSADLAWNTDPALAERLVENLLDNAVSHADGPGEITVSVRAERDDVLLRIGNPAFRAPAESAERAFDPFWRAEGARSHTGRHVGLGLALCRRIVQELGGRLEARLSDGVFTVELSLPRAPIDSAAPSR